MLWDALYPKLFNPSNSSTQIIKKPERFFKNGLPKPPRPSKKTHTSLNASSFMSKFVHMSSLKFDKEKYMRILQSEGVSAALTALHHDTIGWEYEAFEGEKGYQPEMWKDIQQVRDFSRELWEIALRSPEPNPSSK
jgi:hypothetical protein